MDIMALKQRIEEEIPDPRRKWGNPPHRLVDILVIALMTLICNGTDFEDMELFGKTHEADLRKFLGLKNGIPDTATFYRVFRRINPKALCKCLYAWIADAREQIEAAGAF